MTLRERAIALAERLNIAADDRDIEEIAKELEAVADEEFDAACTRALGAFMKELDAALEARCKRRRST